MDPTGSERTHASADATRQDIYAGRRMEWRWVLIGVIVIAGVGTLLAAFLAAFGLDVSSWIAGLLVVTAAFALGGLVIGLLSPGYTVWEAGFASVLAALALVFLAARLLEAGGGILGVLPLATGWGLLCGLAGGRLGEWLQHRADS